MNFFTDCVVVFDINILGFDIQRPLYIDWISLNVSIVIGAESGCSIFTKCTITEASSPTEAWTVSLGNIVANISESTFGFSPIGTRDQADFNSSPCAIFHSLSKNPAISIVFFVFSESIFSYTKYESITQTARVHPARIGAIRPIPHPNRIIFFT